MVSKEKTHTAKRYILLLSIMIVLRDIGGLNINKYIILLFCGVFFLIASYEEFIKSLFFTFPLLCGLPGNYLIPVAIILMILKKHNINKRVVVLLLYFILTELLPVALWGQFDFKIPNEIGYLSTLFFFFLFLYNDKDFEISEMIKMFIFGTTLVSFVIICATIKNAPGDWMTLMSSGYFRFGTIEATEGNNLRMSLNANALSYYSIAGLSCSVFLIRYRKKIDSGLIISMVVLTLAGVLSLSRSWFLDMVILIALFLLTGMNGFKAGIKNIFIIGIFIFSIWLLADKFSNITDGIIERFSRADVANGNGRVDLMNYYWNAIWNNEKYILFGTGVVESTNILGIAKSLHNSLLQLFICYGIVGFLIFVIAWLGPVVKKIGKVKLFYWIPFICIFIYSLGTQIVNPYNLLFPHLMAALALQEGEKNESKYEY